MGNCTLCSDAFENSKARHSFLFFLAYMGFRTEISTTVQKQENRGVLSNLTNCRV